MYVYMNTFFCKKLCTFSNILTALDKNKVKIVFRLKTEYSLTALIKYTSL